MDGVPDNFWFFKYPKDRLEIGNANLRVNYMNTGKTLNCLWFALKYFDFVGNKCFSNRRKKFTAFDRNRWNRTFCLTAHSVHSVWPIWR